MKKVAIVIGHNPRGRGAYSPHLEQSEYEYYRDICGLINKLDDSIDIYSREPNDNYLAEMRPVVSELNKHNYEFIMELHFNAVVNQSVHGSECLVHYRSIKGHSVARNFLKALLEKYGGKLRGRDGLIKVENHKERGGFGICKTKDPYILIEPFFGTSEEAKKFRNKEKFAKFIVDFIRKEVM